MSEQQPLNTMHLLEKLRAHERVATKEDENPSELDAILPSLLKKELLTLQDIEEIQKTETALTTVEQDMADILAQLESELDEESIKQIKEESTKRVYHAAIMFGRYGRAIQLLHDKMLSHSNRDLRDKSGGTAQDQAEFVKMKALIQALKEKQSELVFSSPEAFKTFYLLEMRANKRTLDRGYIVPTEYVRQQQDNIARTLSQKGVVALIGETGTGKTQVAKKVADDLWRERYQHNPQASTEQNQANEKRRKDQGYLMITGNKYTSREDLFGYTGLKQDVLTPEQAQEKAEQAIEQIIAQAEQTATSEGRAFDRQAYMREEGFVQKTTELRRIYTERAVHGSLETLEIIGPVFEAMQQGKVLIIDEFNYIEPGLIAGLNEIMQLKPGDTFTTSGGTTITVAEGFGIIFTGNITTGEMTKRYTHRNDLDAALRNRLNGGIIEYTTLPMTDINNPLENTKLTQQQIEAYKNQKTDMPARDLFQVALLSLIDKKGNLQGPPDVLDRVWDFCQAVKIFQDNYAGRNPQEAAINKVGDIEIRLQHTHISMRQLGEVIGAWKAENYQYDLEWYIYDKIIRGALNTGHTREAAYIINIFRTRYGIFGSTEWTEVLRVDTDEVSTQFYKPPTKETFHREGQVDWEIHTAQEVTEAYAGIAMPEKVKEIGKKQIMTLEEKIALEDEHKPEIEKNKEWEHKMGETVNAICQDEKAITTLVIS